MKRHDIQDGGARAICNLTSDQANFSRSLHSLSDVALRLARPRKDEE